MLTDKETAIPVFCTQRRVAKWELASAEMRRIMKLLNYFSHRAREASCSNVKAAYEQMKYDSQQH